MAIYASVVLVRAIQSSHVYADRTVEKSSMFVALMQFRPSVCYIPVLCQNCASETFALYKTLSYIYLLTSVWHSATAGYPTILVFSELTIGIRNPDGSAPNGGTENALTQVGYTDIGQIWSFIDW